MIGKRTVFILGAGASCPYGFPTARKLRTRIISEFGARYEQHLGDPAEGAYYELRKRYPKPSSAKDLVEKFDRSSTESIDLFLSRWPRFENVGKMAICLDILDAERSSGFGEHAHEPDEDWYFYLYNRLTRELTGSGAYQGFASNNISFVTFNYDRSLEYFLFQSLRHSFQDATEPGVAESLGKIPIVHIYGHIAPLPWQNADEAKSLPYGTDLGDAKPNLLTLVENIHVVHEERGNPELEKARWLMQDAQRIFFLGFGYAKENLEALGFPGVVKEGHEIFGTAMGATRKEIVSLQSGFAEVLRQSGAMGTSSKEIGIRDCDCVALLREFL